MKWLAGFAALGFAFAGSAGAETTTLDQCLGSSGMPRVARVLDDGGRVHYARVVEESAGRPVVVARLAPASTPLAEVFEIAASEEGAPQFSPAHVCAPVPAGQAEIDREEVVIVAAGLNYAAHAEEAGGGDVFLFPKPAAPTGPFDPVHPPAGVTLLDYELELGFVLLADVDPKQPPSEAELLAQSAFFVSNDISDRAPIIREKTFSGPGLGFVEGKGQPGFLPTGPWMVRGSELFAALEACGEDGLGLSLSVDSGSGPQLRQSASTQRMILSPRALVARIGEEIESVGQRTPMPMPRAGGSHFYPFAVGEENALLPAGSLVLTGTPEGVAIHAPSPLGVVLRGMLKLRSPFAQFLEEERARVAAGGTRYLAPGDRVRAQIDGLGAQWFEIGAAGASAPADACRMEGSRG